MSTPAFCVLFRTPGSTLHEIVSGTTEAPLCLGRITDLERVRLTTVEASRRSGERIGFYTIQGSHDQIPRLANTPTEEIHLRDLEVYLTGFVVEIRAGYTPASLTKYGLRVVAPLADGSAVIVWPSDEPAILPLGAALKYRAWVKTLPPVSGVKPWNCTIPLMALARWSRVEQPVTTEQSGEFSDVQEVTA